MAHAFHQTPGHGGWGELNLELILAAALSRGGEELEHVFRLFLGRGAEVEPDEFGIFEKICLTFGEAHGFRHAEGIDDLAIVVSKEFEGEFVFVLEGFLGRNLVHAHAIDFDAFLCKFFIRVAKAACLFGAAGRVGFRIEINERVAFRASLGEFHDLFVLIFLFDRWQRGPEGEWRGLGGGGNDAGGGGEDLGNGFHRRKSRTVFQNGNPELRPVKFTQLAEVVRAGWRHSGAGNCVLNPVPGWNHAASEHATVR